MPIDRAYWLIPPETTIPSLEKPVIEKEVTWMVKHCLKHLFYGVMADDNALAVYIILEAGADGNFMSRSALDHTGRWLQRSIELVLLRLNLDED